MEENELNFEGDKDLVGFIKQAQEVDLFVVLRAGPYICGEWDFVSYCTLSWIFFSDQKIIVR